MPVINGVYLKDFAALPSAVDDANIIPIAISGNQVAYRTTVSGIITDARITSKLLTGLSVTGTAILATDTILQAFGKVQNQLNNRVSSVGLTMPSAFSVANSPVTGSGTLAVSAIGVASQYIRGDGELATLPSGGSGGSSVNYYLNGSVAASVGTYYQMSNTPVIGAGTDFTLSGNGLIAQFLTDAGNPNRLQIPAGAWNFEMFFQISSGGGNTKFYVELLKYNGSTFTSIASSSVVPELITSGTTVDLYLTSIAVPETTLLVTDRLAVRVYIVDNGGGRTVTLHTEDNTLCQVTTTFSGGIAALNGLTANTQYFAVGSTGTDFNISSVTDTHTFNIPSASASNRGLITTGTQTIAGTKTFTGALVGTTANFTGQLTLSSTITNGTYTYTLPSATGTLALTSALSGYLPLTGGTLSTSSAGETLRIVNGGAGFALYVQTNSYFQGNVTFQSVGTSLLKTVSGLLTAAVAGTDYVIPSALSGYLPLAGGTLTGTLFMAMTAPSIQLKAANGSVGGFILANAAGTHHWSLNTDAGAAGQQGEFRIANQILGTNAINISTANAVTLTGALSGTSATFSGLFTQTKDGQLSQKSPVTGTSGFYDFYSNTGGSTYFGIESSTGVAVLLGSLPYASSLGSGGATALHLGTNGTVRQTITSGGNVLIGTTTDAGYKLDVNGIFRATGAATFSSSISATSGNTSTLRLVLNTAGSFSAAGQLGYSSGDGNYIWAKAGSGSNFIILNDSGTVVYTLSNTNTHTWTGAATFSNLAGAGSRTVTADASGTLSASSDASLKQEDLSYKIQGLAEIMQLKPRAYKWLNDIEIRGKEATTEIGFFANEVNPIIPSAAPQGNDGLYGFYDRAVIAAMVNAIQEQQAQIDLLKNK